MSSKVSQAVCVHITKQNYSSTKKNGSPYLGSYPNKRDLRGRLYEDFQPGLKFQLVKRIEISIRLNSKLLFKMTLPLHVEKFQYSLYSQYTQYSQLKFQLGLAKPRWNFIQGWKFQIFQIIDIFPTWNENVILRTCKLLVFFLKNKRWRLHKHVSNDVTQVYQSHNMFTRIQKFHRIPWNI